MGLGREKICLNFEGRLGEGKGVMLGGCMRGFGG